MRRIWWLLAALTLLSCREPGEPVQVWADPALRGAIGALTADLRKSYPAGWAVQYMEAGQMTDSATTASPRPALILCTANALKQLAGENGIAEESSSRTFAGDLLVIVSTKEKDKAVASVGELPMAQFKGLGVGMPDTSIGYYAQQALVSDGAAKPLEGQIHGYEDQGALLQALKGGEVELAFAFASQAAQDPELHVACVVPEDLHEDIRYIAVAAQGHAEDEGVLAVQRLLTEDPSIQLKLGGYGYLDRATAMLENR